MVSYEAHEHYGEMISEWGILVTFVYEYIFFINKKIIYCE